MVASSYNKAVLCKMPTLLIPVKQSACQKGDFVLQPIQKLVHKRTMLDPVYPELQRFSCMKAPKKASGKTYLVITPLSVSSSSLFIHLRPDIKMEKMSTNFLIMIFVPVPSVFNGIATLFCLHIFLLLPFIPSFVFLV